MALRAFGPAQELAGGARHGGAAREEIGLDDLDAQTVADDPRPDFDRGEAGQAKHVHRQPRRHEIIGAMAFFDLEGEQADDNAAVQRFRVPRAVRGLGRDESVAVSGEEGLIGHGAGP